MTEHEHVHGPEHEHHHKEIANAGEPGDFKKPSPPTPAKIIGGSIILASLIVAGSIFYNSGLVLKALEKNAAGAAAQNGNTQALAGAQAQAQPAAPAGPVNITDRSQEPVLGSASAKVTMVEFGDFQCPFCKSYFQQTYPDIKSKYIDTGKVKLVFRHFPLTQIHVNAQISAVAAECANQQGKFWQYHDLLYTNGQSDGTALDKASLEKYADQLGLNSGTLGFGKNKFNQCLEGNATLSIVNADQQEGLKDGVTGTPSFFINGKSIVGAQPASAFEQAIEAALKQ